jgi:hypothetical protein
MQAILSWANRENLALEQVRQLLEYAIAKGEGGVYLRLTPDQYSGLRRGANE